MNRPGFPEPVLFEPPTVRGPTPAVAVLAERYGIGFTDIVKRPTIRVPRFSGGGHHHRTDPAISIDFHPAKPVNSH